MAYAYYKSLPSVDTMRGFWQRFAGTEIDFTVLLATKHAAELAVGKGRRKSNGNPTNINFGRRK
jgi:hypothetical protein